jgi:hypothetical protein
MSRSNEPITSPQTGLEVPICRVSGCEDVSGWRSWGYQYCHKHGQQRREARQRRKEWAAS